VSDQVGEHLEDLRLDLDRAAAAAQLDALEVKDAVGEPQAQGADPPRGRSHAIWSETQAALKDSALG